MWGWKLLLVKVEKVQARMILHHGQSLPPTHTHCRLTWGHLCFSCGLVLPITPGSAPSIDYYRLVGETRSEGTAVDFTVRLIDRQLESQALSHLSTCMARWRSGPVVLWRVVCLDIDLGPPNTCNNTVYTSTQCSLSKKVDCISILFNSVLPGYTLWTSGLVYGAVHAWSRCV